MGIARNLGDKSTSNATKCQLGMAYGNAEFEEQLKDLSRKFEAFEAGGDVNFHAVEGIGTEDLEAKPSAGEEEMEEEMEDGPSGEDDD